MLRLLSRKGQANNCLIHFYKRFQIKSILPGPIVDLIRFYYCCLEVYQFRSTREGSTQPWRAVGVGTAHLMFLRICYYLWQVGGLENTQGQRYWTYLLGTSCMRLIRNWLRCVRNYHQGLTKTVSQGPLGKLMLLTFITVYFSLVMRRSCRNF